MEVLEEGGGIDWLEDKKVSKTEIMLPPDGRVAGSNSINHAVDAGDIAKGMPPILPKS
jgi:hypothetical protein